MEDTILSIYLRHDANITISQGNKILQYLEIEKITGQRYFSFERKDKNVFIQQIIEFVLPLLKNYSITTVLINWANEMQIDAMKLLLPTVNAWVDYPHHPVHAWSAYVFTKPEEMDLVVSFDGGGEQSDYFKIFTYRNNGLCLLADFRINLGKTYRMLGLLSPELYQGGEQDFSKKPSFSLSGKIMALASLGKVNNKFLDPVEKFYNDFHFYDLNENFKRLLCDLKFDGQKYLPLEEARDLLATSQFVFEEKFKRNVYPFFAEKRYKRLILVGGCALNVTLNSMIERDFKLPIFIPPCPNDSGLSLGLQKIHNQNLEMVHSPFFNLPPTNSLAIKQYQKRIPNKEVTIKELAGFLARGKIIGVIHGHLEIGPRALGNRSLLASPLIEGAKDRLNQIKGREFWRPVAPIITWEKAQIYFDILNPSPYMSFAPNVRDKYSKILKEILHYDNSARLQTVNKDSGWIYELVKEFGKLTGFEVLMNTSFNKKGRPLVNDYQEAFEIFENSPIDAIMVENKLFSK